MCALVHAICVARAALCAVDSVQLSSFDAVRRVQAVRNTNSRAKSVVFDGAEACNIHDYLEALAARRKKKKKKSVKGSLRLSAGQKAT